MDLVVTTTTAAEHIAGATHVNFFLLLDFLLRFSRCCITAATTTTATTTATTANTDTSESSLASSQNLVNALERCHTIRVSITAQLLQLMAPRTFPSTCLRRASILVSILRYYFFSRFLKGMNLLSVVRFTFDGGDDILDIIRRRRLIAAEYTEEVCGNVTHFAFTKEID
jgi:hypothetical protein